MNEVNRTLYIPICGKAKWLACSMAMRARVLRIGCGLWIDCGLPDADTAAVEMEGLAMCLTGGERAVFRLLFTGKLYRRSYRLWALEA